MERGSKPDKHVGEEYSTQREQVQGPWGRSVQVCSKGIEMTRWLKRNDQE